MIKIIVTAVALVGLIFNIRRRRVCFVLWLLSNGYWCYYNFAAGEYAQAVLFAVFFVVSIIGFFAWRKSKIGAEYVALFGPDYVTLQRENYKQLTKKLEATRRDLQKRTIVLESMSRNNRELRRELRKLKGK